jgi:hypothetical protein
MYTPKVGAVSGGRELWGQLWDGLVSFVVLLLMSRATHYFSFISLHNYKR